MKTTHTKSTDTTTGHSQTTHSITIEGRAEEFELVIDALESHRDTRIQQMASYIRRALR